MKPSDYIKNVLVTEARDMDPVKARIANEEVIRLYHAFVGICTESGELSDVLKKHIFYGKPIDKVNLIEELGDVMWYIGIACHQLGVSLEEVMEINIAKLKKRYGEKFTEAAALERNLIAEREVLEGLPNAEETREE